MKKYCAIIITLTKSYFIQELQFRFNFIFNIFVTLLNLTAQVVLLSYVFGRSHNFISGWSFESYLLFYGFYGCIVSFLNAFVIVNLAQLPQMIHLGYLDFDLTKPVNLFFLLTFRNVNIQELPKMMLFVVVLVYAMIISPSQPVLFYFVFLSHIFISSLLAYFIIFIICTISFKTIKLDHLNDVVEHLFAFGRFPVKIYGKIVGAVFTYVIPLACLFTYPVQVFVSRDCHALFFWGGTLILTVLLAGISRIILHRCLKGYQSATS